MAITSAQLTAALTTTALSARVLRDGGVTGSVQNWYVQAFAEAPGRCKWLTTTASDDAATQAAAVLTALRAGPA